MTNDPSTNGPSSTPTPLTTTTQQPGPVKIPVGGHNMPDGGKPSTPAPEAD